MITATVCTIGDEILIGQITDTNSPVIARELGKAGVMVRRMLSVGDDYRAISDALSASLGESDVVIVTGGLGPTKDDVTRKVLYDLSGSTGYVTDERQLAVIHRILASRGLDVLEVNRRQADVPDGCGIFPPCKGSLPREKGRN